MAKPMEEHVVPQIVFLAEQDGGPERELKAKLVSLFVSSKKVRKAYLAFVEYPAEKMRAVALCMVMNGDLDSSYAQTIQQVFAGVFNGGMSLDIFAVTPWQELELLRVCRPFYDRRPFVVRMFDRVGRYVWKKGKGS